jgi:hypothetical protein
VSRRLVLLAGVFATAVYISLAYYFKISHVEAVPSRDDVAVIRQIFKTGTPGTFVAHLWLPSYATRATVYENDVSIGEANAVYDDPTRTWVRDGKRFKFVEFNTKGEPARRWVIFSGSAAATSELR